MLHRAEKPGEASRVLSSRNILGMGAGGPCTSSIHLQGTSRGSVKVDVHYYEDGNVRLLTNKPLTASISSGSGASIIREISTAEKKYQEELNKGFTSLSEGAFKGLRETAASDEAGD